MFRPLHYSLIGSPLTSLQWLFDHPAPICEYVFHGREGLDTCCPMGLTTNGPAPGACGCRDDIDMTPYRMAYQLEEQVGAGLGALGHSSVYARVSATSSWRVGLCVIATLSP